VTGLHFDHYLVAPVFFRWFLKDPLQESAFSGGRAKSFHPAGVRIGENCREAAG
jgi:hypothetical protein